MRLYMKLLFALFFFVPLTVSAETNDYGGQSGGGSDAMAAGAAASQNTAGQ